MFKDKRYINAGTNEIYRYGHKAVEKVQAWMTEHNGYYSIPVELNDAPFLPYRSRENAAFAARNSNSFIKHTDSCKFRESLDINPSPQSDNAFANSAAVSCEQITDKAIAILEELGLRNELHSMPSELSGGMARRAALARALTMDADIYLMDEPTRGLDTDTRRRVLNVIHKYTDKAVDAEGKPLNRMLIIISHNPDETEDAYKISL